ncbi:MAG: TonB-dependent receptor [Bacteroidota bacterium]|nr:TonB-dependent receptor [Bacteroidota bacterium]
MTKKRINYALVSLVKMVFFILLSYTFANGQQVIQGIIKDSDSGETLIGANVVIKGSTVGAQTDLEGKFRIETTQPIPVVIVISYIGYIEQEVSVKSYSTITIKLKRNEVLLNDVEVVGSRISEKQKEAPLTVESMDIIAIKETPAANFYEGLGQLKGVDLTSASIGFKVINTRGFNSSSPVRSLQIIDGVDNASPGLNFSLGNFLGASDLDVSKVDLVVGASSAFYGPNAFNGVISMTTRSPFYNPGLEFTFKIGNRGLIENAVRFADVIRNKNGEEKLGYKLNIFYLKVNDWEANNLSATPQSRSDENNPGGYDAVNVYGDEYTNGYDHNNQSGSLPGLGVITRRGYLESDLVDYKTENLKLGGALHYKIRPQTELILASNFGTGSTIYQGDNRYSLKEIKFYQNRIELRKEDKWFIRAYSTNEDAGKSYDAFFTALLLQNSAKSNNEWYLDYVNYWNDNSVAPIRNLEGFPQPADFPTYEEYLAAINPFLSQFYPDTLEYFHNLAQGYAEGIGYPLNENNAFYEPGSASFDTAFASIISRTSFEQGGSRFYDKSALYHIHGEYKFTPGWADLIIGANYRWYVPDSKGTIFSDTSGIKIRNNEGGIYAGVEKKVISQKLKLSATVRMDKNENFDYLFSPAFSAVYIPDKQQVVRGSFSSAIRNPTLSDQYLYYPVGRAILIGNKDGYEGLVTVPSLIDFFDANKKFDTLSFFSVSPVKPEEVKTVEIGYRTTLSNKIYVDISAYHSWYTNFIGYKIGADVDTFSISSPFGTYKDLRFNNVVRIATNSEDEVTTRGVTVGLNYYIGKFFAFTTNYSYNLLDKQGSDDPLIPAYNTPEHKFNIGFNGRGIRNFSFNINFKWIDGFRYEGSPQFTGIIDSYHVVDAQVNYKFFDDKLMFKLGASNLLNNEHYELYGGPLIGRLYYFSINISAPSKNLK